MSEATIVLCLAVCVGAVGIGVLLRSASPQSGPRCGNCRYNLTGAASNRCPECGKLFIEAGVLLGEKRRRRVGVAAIAFVLLLGFATAGMIISIQRVQAARASVERARAAEAAVQAFLPRTLAASQPAGRPGEEVDGTEP